MAFQPTRVSRVLAAAAHPDIDPTDALDDIILHNAKAHADSPPGAILNLSDGLVLRIDQLLGTDAPPDADAELQKRLHPGLPAKQSAAPQSAATRKRPGPSATGPSAPAPVSETTTDPVSEETTDESETADDTETDPDLDPLT